MTVRLIASVGLAPRYKCIYFHDGSFRENTSIWFEEDILMFPEEDTQIRFDRK